MMWFDSTERLRWGARACERWQWAATVTLSWAAVLAGGTGPVALAVQAGWRPLQDLVDVGVWSGVFLALAALCALRAWVWRRRARAWAEVDRTPPRPGTCSCGGRVISDGGAPVRWYQCQRCGDTWREGVA